MARKYFVTTQYLSIFLSLALCVALSSPSFAAERVPANISQSSISMLGHFDWIINPNGTLTIEAIQQEEIQSKFQPLNLKDIPRESGSVWLRFTLAERDPRTPPQTLLLDMGNDIPATPTLYVPKYNMLTGTAQWQEYTPTQQSVFLMPEARSTPTTAYIRMEGMPGLWFSPTLRTPHDAATSLERLAGPAIIVALGVVMLLCLLRGLTERGQWRIWASLYTAVALFYAIWGIPPTGKGYIALQDMPAVLAPGIALILFPHVARHLMRSNVSSRIIDVQYILLNLPGMIIALVPLIPGYAWTVRYLALWPLLTLLFVPTTLGAWLSGLPGARRFLLGTLFPPAGAALALVGLQEPHFLPLSILETLPLWGVAIGTLIIAGTTTPQEYTTEAKKSSKQKAKPAGQESSLDLNLDSHDDSSEENLDDPNLRIINIEKAQDKASDGDAHTPNSSLEESLRWPVDQLLRDVMALESCALPPAVREYVTSINSVARDISNTLSAPVQERSGAQAMVIHEDVFELQGLLRQAHDSVSPLADSKNIALSWFMPPHLSQHYKGDAMHLLFVLQLLLESSVRATNRGAVQLAVRRVPESVNPGHLLFTVTDTGTGKPPQERSITSLARAWELAASSHGFLGVESNASGATISFTLHCTIATPPSLQSERKAKEMDYPRIIIVSDNDADRQLWAFFLENMPYTIVEARNKKEALALYAEQTVDLIIFNTDKPTHILEQNINELRQYETEHQLNHAPYVAIYTEQYQQADLESIGFNHCVAVPITRSNLRDAITEALAIPSEEDHVQATPTENEFEIIETGLPLLDMSQPHVPHAEQTTSSVQENTLDPALDIQSTPPDEMELTQDESPYSESEPESELEPELESEPEAELESESESEPESEPESELEPEAELESEPESESEPELESTLEPELETEPEQTSEPEIESKPATEKDSAVVQPIEQYDIYSGGWADEDEDDYGDEYSESDAAEIARALREAGIITDDASETTQDEPTSEPVEDSSAMDEVQQATKEMQEAETETKAETETEAEEVKAAPKAKLKINQTPTISLRKKKVQKATATEPTESTETLTEPVIEKFEEELPKDTLLLPGIDPSKVRPQAMYDNIEEESAEQSSDAPYTLPARDKSNAAYLTSLIDTSSADATKPEAKEEVVDKKPAMKVVRIKTAPPKDATAPVKKAESSEPIAAPDPANITPENNAMVKPTPAPILTPDQVSAQDEPMEWVGEPTPVVKETTQQPKLTRVKTVARLKNTPAESTPAPTIQQTQATSEPAPTPKPMPTWDEPLEWVGEPTPIERAPITQDSTLQPLAMDDVVIGEPTPIVKDDIPFLSMDPIPNEKAASTQPSNIMPELSPFSSDRVKPIQSTAQAHPSSSYDEWVGEPTPIIKEQPPKKSLNIFKSVAEKLDAKLAQKTKKTTAQPMQSVLPLPGLEQKQTSDQGPNPWQDLLNEIDEQLIEAKEHFKLKNTQAIAMCTGKIAHSAESFGLRTLGRLARTVEAAAKAGDMDALHDLFPELEINIERNRITLQM